MRRRGMRPAKSKHYLRGYLYVIRAGYLTTAYVKSRGTGQPQAKIQWEARPNHLGVSVTRYPKRKRR